MTFDAGIRLRSPRSAGGVRRREAPRTAGLRGCGDARETALTTASSGFELSPSGPYSLAASARFLEDFAPAAHESAGDHLHLAFPDPEGRGAGVCLRQREDGVVIGEGFGQVGSEWLRSEVERILSLDVDGSGFAAVGERDPTIGRLQQRFEGLRPVLFLSPFEAGAWAIISHRLRIVQASRVKARVAEELGQRVDIHGDVRVAFPGPDQLGRLESFPGLFARKVEWLRALAAAAQEGLLDAERLRALTPDEALSQLKALPGIGDFSAELVLLRGAGEPDYLPTAEPRLRRAVALAYDMDGGPSNDEVEELAEAWRPYRTWAAVLLRSFLEAQTREIEGRGG